LDMLNHDVHLSVPLDECIIYNESLAVGWYLRLSIYIYIYMVMLCRR
jgi:hypothetical protein